MKRSTAAAAVAGGMLLAVAGAARAERFAGVKYLGGVEGIGPRTGTLVIEDGQLRFEDRKGREVFTRNLDAASAWVGTEKRTRLGRVIRNAALLPLTVPLTGGHGNPWIGGDRTDSPIAMVRTGTDPTPLRLRVPVVELQKVVETVGREAAKALREATSPRPDAAESDPSGRCLQIAPESPPETH